MAWTLTRAAARRRDEPRRADGAEAPLLAGVAWPAPASRLFGGQNRSGPPRHDLAGGVYSLGGEEDCCVKLAADTPRARKLMRRVNAAFAAVARRAGFPA